MGNDRQATTPEDLRGNAERTNIYIVQRGASRTRRAHTFACENSQVEKKKKKENETPFLFALERQLLRDIMSKSPFYHVYGRCKQQSRNLIPV